MQTCKYFIILLLFHTTKGILLHKFIDDFNVLEEPYPAYDFIIVGSGSSGSVLANRLSEIFNWRILLIEAGKRPSIITDVPAIAPVFQFTDYNWGYKMEKTPNVCLGMVDQQCPWPRGKGLGGSTLINYMIYTRGNKEDFDAWEAQGNPGWSYKDVLPYYIFSERANLKYQDKGYHGFDGLLSVEDVRYHTPIRNTFLEAGRELGYPYVDYNGRTQDGFSNVQSNTKNGFRHSGYRAFIQRAELRPNLHVLTNSRVTKVLIDPITKQAYGVELIKNRKYYWVNVTKEVILSAGALASPQLLMLSGIGPKSHLESFQIPVYKDSPGVGQNLHDHITFLGLVFELNQTVSSQQRDIEDPAAFLNWTLYGKGPLTILGGVEALGYYRTNIRPNLKTPDIEFIFISGSMNTDNGLVYRKSFGISDEVYNRVWKPLENKPVWTILPMLMHPKSIGHLKLKTTKPFYWPKFYGNYLSDPENIDVKTFIAAIREIIRLSKTNAFQKYGSKLHDIPIPGCEMHKFNSDPYWECAVRHVSMTLHHQVGTCKMGPKTDPLAVVDNKARVYGIKGLRVVDTSIIPFAITAHTNAPAYMLGEKIGYEIKRKWKVL